MKGLSLKKFKKMKEDKDWATLIHEDGHQLNIAKAPLSPIERKQLEALEMHEDKQYAKGGKVKHYDEGGKTDNTIDYANANYADQPTPENAPYGSGAPIPEPSSVASNTNSQIADNTPSPQALNLTAASNPQSSDQAPVPSQQSVPGPATPVQSIGEAQNTGLAQEQEAEKQKAIEIGKEGAAKAAQYATLNQQLQDLDTQNDIKGDYDQKDAALERAYASKTLDPSKYWDTDNNPGGHSKLLSGIGILVSALGQVGAGGTNTALDTIHNGIQQEIERQKDAQGQAMNLWKMNREHLGNDLAANLATYNQLASGAQYQIAQTAASAEGPIAKQIGNIAIAKLRQIKDANNFKRALMNPSSDNPDPASRIQFLVPLERQQKVVDEMNAAKATVANAPGILEAFDQAAKEVRPLSGGTGTSLTAFVPGIKSAGQSALQARLGPTFQNLEGTVRQAAMDNSDHNMTPHFGDSDSTIATKRQSLTQYLTSKAAEGSASKSFGIDLTKFPSTNTAAIGNAQPQTKVVNGITYARGPQGQAIRVK